VGVLQDGEQEAARRLSELDGLHSDLRRPILKANYAFRMGTHFEMVLAFHPRSQTQGSPPHRRVDATGMLVMLFVFPGGLEVVVRDVVRDLVPEQKALNH
jgi:hypothetical protein